MIWFEITFAFLSGIVYLAGFVPYIYHVFHGRVIPHAFSWSVWLILGSINTYTLYTSEWLTASLFGPIVRIVALLIGSVIAWMYISKIHITLSDKLAIILAVLCIIVASTVGVSHAIIPTILVDILVLMPTLRKVWENPFSEDALTWLLIVFSQACTLLSLGTYSVENSLFWAYLLVSNALVALFIWQRQCYIENGHVHTLPVVKILLALKEKRRELLVSWHKN